MKSLFQESNTGDDAVLMAIYEAEMHQLADLCDLKGDHMTAVFFYREALDLRRIMYGMSSYESASLEIKLSSALKKIGNPQAAEIADHGFAVLNTLAEKGVEKAVTLLEMEAAFAA